VCWVLSDRQVVEQGSESHLIPFPCCLAHASGQRNLGHAVEDSRPSGSLLPSRGALSSPASYRFIPAPSSHVPQSRLAQDQATYMPDTVPPVNRFRRNLSRNPQTDRGVDIVLKIFDMRSGGSLSFLS
jgi:hypothetical protein